MKKVLFFLTVILCTLMGGQALARSISIGFNLSLTGEAERIGKSSMQAAEMLRTDINEAGGLDVGGQRYKLEFLYEDNVFDTKKAVAVAQKFIKDERVVAVLGPNSSTLAIPVGGVCNEQRMPMLSPWSTNPATTFDRPWVFRVGFLDSFQAVVAAKFAGKKFGAKTAAVLFDGSDSHAAGIAPVFRDEWEKRHGKGSVVAYEAHGAQDVDYSRYLKKILAAKPDFIYVPSYYNKAAVIIDQALELGWTGPFVGSDAWGTADLLEYCGPACIGHYFSTHYATSGVSGTTEEFIDRFTFRYGSVPDEVAALTWDAVHLVLKAIQDTGMVVESSQKMRKAVRDALAAVDQFEGVTGQMRFDEQGDPVKCAIMVRIDENGEFVFEQEVCPEKP